MINELRDETGSVLIIINVSLQYSLSSLQLYFYKYYTLFNNNRQVRIMPLLSLTAGLGSGGCIGLRDQSIGSGVTPNILIGLVTIMVHCTMLVFHGGPSQLRFERHPSGHKLFLNL